MGGVPLSYVINLLKTGVILRKKTRKSASLLALILSRRKKIWGKSSFKEVPPMKSLKAGIGVTATLMDTVIEKKQREIDRDFAAQIIRQ